MKHWLHQDRDQRAVTLASLPEGITFDEAAEMLGITPNALHGACFRGKLKRPGATLPTEWQTLATPEARIVRVKEMDAAGMSATQIGRVLGTSAGSVVSLMHRNKQPLFTSGVQRRPEPAFAVHPLPPAETWAPLDGTYLPMDHLNEHTCRWPIEENDKHVGFCGQHVHAKSYCAHHHAMAYRGTGRAGPAQPDSPAKPRPISSLSAMRMAGVPARKVESVE